MGRVRLNIHHKFTCFHSFRPCMSAQLLVFFSNSVEWPMRSSNAGGVVATVKLASTIGYCNRRRRIRYMNQGPRSTAHRFRRRSSHSRRQPSPSIQDQEFVERVYDIEIEDPLLNIEKVFEAFDVIRCGSISVEEFLCGIVVTSLGNIWSVPHRLQVCVNICMYACVLHVFSIC